MSGPRWEKYGATWHRRPVVCAGCQAEAHDPGAFRWWFLRDAPGFTISRCPRCVPISRGHANGALFGLTTRRRAAKEG